MKYRKKPVVIEAMIWEDNGFEIAAFMKQGVQTENKRYLIIPTLEGDMKADLGDYIIKGVRGEFYPCKPDIFLETYELVEEDLKDSVQTIPNKIINLDDKEVKEFIKDYKEFILKYPKGLPTMMNIA